MADEATAKDPLMAEFGRRGGKSRMTKMTAEERRRVAKLAAQARWSKKGTTPEPPPNGPSPDRDAQGAEAGIMLNSRRRPAHRVPSTQSARLRRVA